MPQSTIIPKTGLQVYCKHLNSDDDVAYWFLFEELDLLLVACEPCTEEHMGAGGTVETLLLRVLGLDGHPSLAAQTIH